MVGFTIVLGKRRKKGKTFSRHKHKKNKSKIYYFLPLIFIVLFALGASFFINEKPEEKIFVPNQISDFKSTDDYSKYYIPIVVNNFTSYNKGEKAGNKMLIKLGVWSILCSTDTQQYEAFDGELVIPANIVKEKVEELFSQEISIKNETVSEEKYSIIFDEQTDSFFIPTIGLTPEYTPLLESVETKSNETILTVGCLKSENYKQDSSGNTVVPEADKRIIITLRKDKENFYIGKISEE